MLRGLAPPVTDTLSPLASAASPPGGGFGTGDGDATPAGGMTTPRSSVTEFHTGTDRSCHTHTADDGDGDVGSPADSDEPLCPPPVRLAGLPLDVCLDKGSPSHIPSSPSSTTSSSSHTLPQDARRGMPSLGLPARGRVAPQPLDALAQASRTPGDDARRSEINPLALAAGIGGGGGVTIDDWGNAAAMPHRRTRSKLLDSDSDSDCSLSGGGARRAAAQYSSTSLVPSPHAIHPVMTSLPLSPIGGVVPTRTPPAKLDLNAPPAPVYGGVTSRVNPAALALHMGGPGDMSSEVASEDETSTVCCNSPVRQMSPVRGARSLFNHRPSQTRGFGLGATSPLQQHQQQQHHQQMREHPAATQRVQLTPEDEAGGGAWLRQTESFVSSLGELTVPPAATPRQRQGLGSLPGERLDPLSPVSEISQWSPRSPSSTSHHREREQRGAGRPVPMGFCISPHGSPRSSSRASPRARFSRTGSTCLAEPLARKRSIPTTTTTTTASSSDVHGNGNGAGWSGGVVTGERDRDSQTTSRRSTFTNTHAPATAMEGLARPTNPGAGGGSSASGSPRVVRYFPHRRRVGGGALHEHEESLPCLAPTVPSGPPPQSGRSPRVLHPKLLALDELQEALALDLEVVNAFDV